ncbi:MAG: CopG family transcriptional regulator [Lachnospiraceae bacterium]|nr:CopG family transcriptional regulator [Lachnospiraceae bacterium]
MSKMGRPKSSIIKDRIVTIRMSDEEHLRLKEYSKQHQQTITDTIKSGVDLLYKTRG